MVEKAQKLQVVFGVCHVRKFRPAQSYKKALAKNRRLYFTLDKASVQNVNEKSGALTLAFELPTDLADAIDRGEIELVSPKEDCPIFAGDDLNEFLASKDRKEKRKRIRTLRSAR